MHFNENQIFHIYNQGNNRRQLFYSDDNYAYFLWKMKMYLLPFGDMISWCLMPNHFHWQFLVRKTTIPKIDFIMHQNEVSKNWRNEKYGLNAFVIEKLNTDLNELYKDQNVSLNSAIGTLQQSYAKAINKSMGWTGSLFRGKCKAKDGFNNDFMSVIGLDRSENYFYDAQKDYAFRCFQYIHENPVLAGLAVCREDYKWSSAQDYKYHLENSICNLELGYLITREQSEIHASTVNRYV